MCWTAKAKISARVVKRVAIDVVNELPLLRTGNDSVHVDGTLEVLAPANGVVTHGFAGNRGADPMNCGDKMRIAVIKKDGHAVANI